LCARDGKTRFLKTEVFGLENVGKNPFLKTRKNFHLIAWKKSVFKNESVEKTDF